MVYNCDKEITLVCKTGETLQVSQNLLEESSNYLRQVLSNSSSTVLLFPDVQYEDLKDLICQVELGKLVNENICDIALKYGFKTENISAVETHLPLKKRALDHSPLSSPELVIDESYSPTYPRSVSPPSEVSLSPFLPWPLLLQQVAMQKLAQSSTKELDKSSSRITKSSLFDPVEPSENQDKDELISCEDCGKKFKATNLVIHMRRVHRVLQKPAKCCGQEFPTRWHLTQHRKSGDHLPTLWKTGSVIIQ